MINAWFVLGTVLGVFFVAYSALYATKVLNIQTLEIARSMLVRPITRVDCIFYEWRYLGEVPVSLVITGVLGGICVLAGFRRRVVLFLVLLLLVGVGVELVGKKALALPLPATLRSGMTVLECPQLTDKPLSYHLDAATAQWSKIPDPPHVQVSWAHDVYQMPFVFKAGEIERSFPGGHAARWSFLGIIECWLCWRLIRSRVLRVILLPVFFLGSFVGGFMQFWIGVHFITDTISGYLLGAALACYAIWLLTLNDSTRIQKRQGYATPPADMVDTLRLPVATNHSFSGPRR
ncbi:MAG: hypothetical protein NVS2B12_02250 [Ktedonobacteraceae bacterium]